MKRDGGLLSGCFENCFLHCSGFGSTPTGLEFEIRSKHRPSLRKWSLNPKSLTCRREMKVWISGSLLHRLPQHREATLYRALLALF